MTTHPAFELLRKHKNVSEETEALVLKRTRGKIASDDLFTCFENGISGQYGKIYSLDPQTLLGWVDEYQRKKTSSSHYMEAGLELLTTHHRETVDWCKEANKCLSAFYNGVSESFFHPCVYDRMMVDGKIPLNACMKYLEKDWSEEKVRAAKQRVLRDIFLTYKSQGWNQVYFI